MYKDITQLDLQTYHPNENFRGDLDTQFIDCDEGHEQTTFLILQLMHEKYLTPNSWVQSP